MEVMKIKTSEIKLPTDVQNKEYPENVLMDMAEELKKFGWPKGNELG